MGLIEGNTGWFFILPSKNEVEERHIYDIAFGIKCLLSKKIKQSSILVFIDNVPKVKINAVFSKMDIAPTLPIFKIANLDNLLRIKKFDNAVVFVTGHGSINGLDSELPIKPFLFYKKFQVISKLKKVIFYFGQCYSGVFNQIPLKTHLGLKRFKLPNIIAIGCTGLFPSLSTSVTVENVTWVANIFLIYVFNWISNPIDIDGDGHFSVIDSFKIATFYTNNAITDIKENDTVQNLLQQNQLTKLISSLSNPTLSRNEQDNIRLEIQALEKMLEIRYITQESWILNTDIAISTYF